MRSTKSGSGRTIAVGSLHKIIFCPCWRDRRGSGQGPERARARVAAQIRAYADITGAGIVSMSAEALVGHAGPEGNELWAA